MKVKRKKDPLGPVVSFRIRRSQLQLVQELAKATDRPLAHVLRNLVSRGLQA